MHDHNLDDLILDAKPGQSKRTVSLLTILSLFIVVLVAGIVFSQMMLEGNKPAVPVEENTTLPITSDLALKKPSTENNDQVPVPKPTAPAPSPKSVANNPQTSDEHIEIAELDRQPLPAPKQTAATHPKKTEPKPRPKPKAQPKSKQPARVTHDTTPAKKTSSPTKPRTTSIKYYVQVGSYSNPPASDADIIKKIRAQGFRYTVLRVNGMYKVLIGPYTSRAYADRAIQKVRRTITSQAFVYTVK